MNKKLKVVVIRILILVVPIVALNLWHLLTFNPHARCSGGIHRHVDGYLGIAMLSIFWFYVWIVLIVLETLDYLLRRYFKSRT